jgi:hypothetical protein
MISIFYITAAILLSGIAYLVRELYLAPEGYETAEGFNIAWKNNSPQVADVSCVWLTASNRAR